MPPLLEARHLGRCHPQSDRWLLREVCTEVRAGDRVAVVGASGSGKTVLCRALALLDPLDAGDVLWQGQVVRHHGVPRFRGHAIYLHQRPPLWEGTVETNLQRPFQLQVHHRRRYDRQRVVAWLARVGREASFLEKAHANLSGGEAQLVALVRALQLDPHALLLDEPTAALDGWAARAVEELVTQWLAEDPDQRATVWISHDHEQAERVGTRIWTVGDGRVVERR